MFSLPHDVIKFVMMEVAEPYFKTVFFLYSFRGEGFVPYESFFGKRSLVIVDISKLLVVNDCHLKI